MLGFTQPTCFYLCWAYLPNINVCLDSILRQSRHRHHFKVGFSPPNYFIGRLLVDIENFSLPNILAGEKIQTELLQGEVRAEKIAEETLKLYRGEAVREKILEELEKVCKKLGGGGAAERIAEKILKAAGE